MGDAECAGRLFSIEVAPLLLRKEHLDLGWVSVGGEGLERQSIGVEGGADDFLVECADSLVLEVVVDWHPEAFGDFFVLHGDAGREREESANEVDVGHAVAVAVLVSEADEGVELGFDAGFFTDFARYGIRKVFAMVEVSSREFEGACADAAPSFADDEDMVSLVDDDAACADVVGRVTRDECAILKWLEHHDVSVGCVMIDEASGGSHRDERRAVQRRL